MINRLCKGSASQMHLINLLAQRVNFLRAIEVLKTMCGCVSYV